MLEERYAIAEKELCVCSWQCSGIENWHSVLPALLVLCHLLGDVLQIHCDGAANELLDGCLLSDIFLNFIAALLFHLSLCKLGAFTVERLQVSFERFKQCGGLGRPQPR